MGKKKTAAQPQTDGKKICKAIHQYSSGKINREDMDRLLDIAQSCKAVCNYVYQKYGGIKSLDKIYPGYTVQNEMTASGLREKLNLPSVYFYPAVFNALREIKTQWTHVKRNVYAAINENEKLTPEDKHYLRFAVKIDGCFFNILNGKPVLIPAKRGKGIRAWYNAAIRQGCVLWGDTEKYQGTAFLAVTDGVSEKRTDIAVSVYV